MKKKNIIPMLIGAISGGVIGFYGAKIFVDESGNKEMALSCLIVLVVSYFLHIIIHESGHLLFGLFSGYQFVSFRVGSLIFYKSKGQYKFGKYKLAGTGGQCLMSPPEFKDGMIPYRLYNMGGAIMNLLFSIPTMLIWVTAKPDGLGKIICILWTMVGLFSAAANGIPMSIGPIDNDGKNAINLGKNRKALRAFGLQLKVNKMQMEGYLLSEMPEEWFELPEMEDMENPMIAVLGALHCNRLMEGKHFEEVSYKIGELLQGAKGMLGVHRLLLQLDQVFCEIMSSQNEKILNIMNEKQMKQFMNSMKNYPAVLRTQYAYALNIEKDVVKAEKIKRRFENIMKTYPIQGELNVERQFIEM